LERKSARKRRFVASISTSILDGREYGFLRRTRRFEKYRNLRDTRRNLVEQAAQFGLQET
jgi:hypothetical protein